MSLRVYNTLSGKKEEFQPLVPNKVGMYVCGVTVYDYCHIGHARANIVFDIVYRYLQYSNYDVTYVRNYTDVDDKIIARANERGITSQALSEEFIDAFDEDMAALGLRKPTHEPKATEHIAQIIALVQGLIAKGMAYESAGDVYYSVDTFPSYLKLSKRNMEEMQAGARIAPGELKRNPMDFALWKTAKPGEPSWESPWGAGRPGWHIECSAMSSALLGETFDIHGGGRDLIFPHHENEIAQSEGASGKPFVKYWLHNGFVNVNQEKMSKSLGNFFTIRDILKSYDAEVVRFFILTAHYRSPIDFSDQNLEESRHGLTRFYEALAQLDKGLAKADKEAPQGAVPESLAEPVARLTQLEERFRAAMDDDFNTALAIGHMFDAVRAINRILAEENTLKGRLQEILGRGRDDLLRLGEVLGLFVSEPSAWLARSAQEGLSESGLSAKEIESLILERREARANKDFARSDQIRDDLAAKGIQLLDGPEGTTWKMK
ncbi:MAG: cysteine--tRNA ligase [Desulfuromonadales bacterium]|jgi:cysteinyl-tRNA synthetase|nr:cysteine--tRNA ligase [Desulfuromonadales bacterium]MDH3807498.1 cysteine--tRNA ligase [Desulfuromonadales bacterium]MDH3868606.1 cysteine--tRNA ligase [Desulfuromonadales bacterium]MDH3960778.1 cysteine--tRNA ligase [Desulfuromonadales bacterium]MDH4024332.1 cysteine--tRNA ligase [Desulfuromonadales bacterium]